MHWIVRTANNLFDSVKEHQNEFRGAVIGGASGFLSHPFYKDWIQPIMISIICAVAGLLITHYGKKILLWIDKKMDL
jgi:hypothetical protein